ncbi:MAG: DUF1778 domain-containing protein [Desulfovibrio sp.]|jgi:uncharacterized protein (DUF1778 family)|nr:DUF1778 domain-containing protein [Desulfovibrio sp.]
MPQQTAESDSSMSRIDARIPLAVRETIDRAAAMQGRTRTDFLIGAALEKAARVIKEHSIIRLAVQDQMLLAEALLAEKSEKTTLCIDEALQEYAARVVSK